MLSKVKLVQAPRPNPVAAALSWLSKGEAVYSFQQPKRSCEKDMPMIAIMAQGPVTAEAAHRSPTALSSPQDREA